MTLDHLAHLRADSSRFAAVLQDAPADGPVPPCPDWRADDLLWHLAEVQWFWGTVVRDAVPDPGGLQHPDRPAAVPRRGRRSSSTCEATLRVSTTDTGRSWLVTLGRLSGTSPDSGTTYTDEPLAETTDADASTPAAAAVAGRAADVDCWLWGRPTIGQLDRSGDEEVLARFQQVVCAGIE